MKRFFASLLLIAVVAGLGYGIVKIKEANSQASVKKPQKESAVAVTAYQVVESDYQNTTTTVGTVRAIQSVLLRNEIAGVVQKINLVSGQTVKRGDVLVQLDTSVEIADMKMSEAELVLAKLKLSKIKDAFGLDVGTDLEVTRRQTEYDVARAKLERTKAMIAKKTLIAPFDARVGIVDVHPGQYMDAGALIVNLQSVDESVYVDFYVSQDVALRLKKGDVIPGTMSHNSEVVMGKIDAIDSMINEQTRNAKIRTKFDSINKLRPGGSLIIKVPVGSSHRVPAIPVTALRRSPEGAHVFVIIKDKEGKSRAELRQVTSGQMQGDHVFIHKGLKVGELVVAKGSFKVRNQSLLNIKDEK